MPVQHFRHVIPVLDGDAPDVMPRPKSLPDCDPAASFRSSIWPRILSPTSAVKLVKDATQVTGREDTEKRILLVLLPCAASFTTGTNGAKGRPTIKSALDRSLYQNSSFAPSCKVRGLYVLLIWPKSELVTPELGFVN